jgi:hypothetical protein
MNEMTGEPGTSPQRRGIVSPRRRHTRAITRASALVFAGLLCLLATRAPAAPQETPVSSGLGTSSQTHLASPRAAPLHSTSPFADPVPPPEQWLPLVMKNYYRLPPWSGTARFGFGVVKNPVEQYSVSSLGAEWYLGFGFRADPPLLGQLEYVQMVRLSETGYLPGQYAIEQYARAQPGTLWLVGNEPDAHAQDCVTPHGYAQLYHELYGIIKGADPTAKVAIGGVVEATPLRLQYLDMILDEYQTLYGEMIPVDVWNVHGFILPEKKNSWGCQIPCGIEGVTQGMQYTIDDHDNMTIFRQQIRDFRVWMNDHGERNKPLIVSEYGILLPEELGFDEPRVEAFMLATFDYFLNTKVSWLGYPADENRLVQAWAWYSLDDDQFEGYTSHSHLFSPTTKEMTALGRAYRDYTASLP